MGKYEKLLEQILLGSSDANIDFDELCRFWSRWDSICACGEVTISSENKVWKSGLTFNGTAARRKCIKSARCEP